MEPSRFHLKTWLALSALTGFFCLSTPVIAQSAPAKNNPALQADDAVSYRLLKKCCGRITHHEPRFINHQSHIFYSLAFSGFLHTLGIAPLTNLTPSLTPVLHESLRLRPLRTSAKLSPCENYPALRHAYWQQPSSSLELR
jgi:hypothetical protein